MAPVEAAFDFPRHPLSREDGERVQGLWRRPPDEWHVARRPEEVAPLLDRMHAQAMAGAWVLGGLRYEAAGALNPVLACEPAEGVLAAFALYRDAPQAWPAAEELRRCTGPWQQALHTPDADRVSIEKVRRAIREGEVYQINLTTRLCSELADGVDFADLFWALHRAQPGGFSLFLRTMDHEGGVASVSPELFFDWRPLPDHHRTWLLGAQPMKGTAPRGVDAVTDEAAQLYLRTSEKERAENLMIVDLLRNDMGQVAQVGSVRVPRLFELHALSTVWQMTSTVTAVTPARTPLSAVFAALFPCGSVTGAPKRQAMQLIHQLEGAPRGWYCGALGLIQPGGAVTFNVPIRTVELRPSARLRAGVGSGITLDSDPDAELREWRAKTRFLVRAQAPVQGLETLRLEDGCFPHAEAHLARLGRSARQFGLSYSAAGARRALAEIAKTWPDGVHRVRLVLPADGRLAYQVDGLQPAAQPVRLALAPWPIDTQGPDAEFLTHKTTRREVYEAYLSRKPTSLWDWVLVNESGELTEGCFGNVAIKKDGLWLTPRAAAGLLPGVGRANWLEQGRLREACLTPADWALAEEVAWFNALRGWVKAVKA
ncbi:chorismate-binding protein [Inhella gelatinilytica]|uniref:Chorismate-binding protein n=1 Tax=Inhella gelatinilytica TaxID=2795030 RepID=A0A931J008_9BURK|nr:chorismate-binding protein [Inhella gelatinilytica]MBH9554145.1 chorismate-binding protein [Inhella gelatinilytica]